MIISDEEMIGIISGNLKRALKTVDRKRLLMILYQYGIRGRVLDWLRSYPTERNKLGLIMSDLN